MAATTNRRAVYVKPQEALLLDETPLSACPERGVLVKTHYAGLCHSDVGIWEGKWPMFTPPVVLGHEISGEIYDIGDKVDRDDLKIGDHVVCYSWVGCKECAVCKNGEERYCRSGIVFHGMSQVNQGGFQQYVSVRDAADVLKLPLEVAMDVGSLLGCSALTSYSGVCSTKSTIENAIRVEGSATLLIIGVGGLGQWAISHAKALLSRECRVICADISEERAASAVRCGADDVVVWPPTASEDEIESRTRAVCPGGFHATIDFVGTNVTSGRAVKFLNSCGYLAMIGLYGGCAENIDLVTVAIKGLTIRGLVTGSPEELKTLIQLVGENKVKSPPITKIKLEELNEYLLRVRDAKVQGRAVVDFVN